MYKRTFLFLAFLFIFTYISAQEPIRFDLEKYLRTLSAPLADSIPDKKLIRLTPFPIGTHHSLSYVKPKWYWMPFNWMIKCQNLSLEEQLDCGVIYFDIRVRFQKDKVISGHGVINYNIDVLEQLEKLNRHSKPDRPIYVRIMYESNPFYKNPSEEKMKNFMEELLVNYPDLVFTECHIRNPYTLIGTYNHVPKYNYYQFYKDYGAKTFWKKVKGIKLPYPVYYAKKNNGVYWHQLIENKINIVDFVDIQLCPPKTYLRYNNP